MSDRRDGGAGAADGDAGVRGAASGRTAPGGAAPGGGEPRIAQGPRLLRVGTRSIIPVGAHVVPPEGPDWPWRVGPEAFDRAFAAMAALGLDVARIDLMWAAVEPEPGRYDEKHLRVLDEILGSARRRGIRLHPTLFVGGEVGDAYWDIPWRAGRHPHRDPELRRLQAAHAGMLARRWRGDPAVLAWDLTDEPPMWLFPDTTDDDSRAWTTELAAALRAEDPGALVTIGTASQEIGWGPFRADVVAGDLDFATVHPYPIYSPGLYPDGLLSPRMTRAGAFETALAAGAGRPVMLHEYGASSAQFAPERIAAYDRLLSWSSLGAGATGFVAWCWTDAQPAAYRRAPYVRGPHETQFGVTKWDGTLRPRGRVLADLAATVRALDLDAQVSRGPVTTAAILVPHEYARPYDPGSYGLDDAPAGPYEPAERAWTPDRDPTPLIRGLLNAYVLASRVGVACAFPREALDDAWPATPLLLLPAPLASTSSTLHHVRSSSWNGAAAFFARGGTAWVSCSADVAIAGMADLLGARILDRARGDLRPVLRFVAPWGPFTSGATLELPPWDGALATRSVLLEAATGSRVVAVDAAGEPALVVADRSAGHAVVCSHPAELLLAVAADAHGSTDRSWGLYAGLATLAGAVGPAGAGHPDAGVSSLLGDGGGAIVATNHAGSPLRVCVQLPDDAAAARLVGSAGAEPATSEGGAVEVALEPYGAAIVSWRRGGGGPA